MHLETKFIHSGNQGDKYTGSVVTPIYLATTYAQIHPGNEKYEYSRISNPTRDTLEACMAECENGKYCVAFSSGLAAINSVINMFDKINLLSIDDLYGGTKRMFTNDQYHSAQINYFKNSFQSLDEVENIIINNNISHIWLETPTNPLLKCIDIKHLSILCNKYNIILIVDNTFASPYLQNPLNLGAHIVVHSATKYINGHADVIMGFSITNEKKYYEKLKNIQYCVGAVPSPFDCYLCLRGLKTLHVRMKQCSANAKLIVCYLQEKQEENKIGKIYYPDHPQMRNSGGMISFELNKPIQFINEIAKKLKMIKLAESLGSVETLIEIPALMTHSQIPKEEREKICITENLIRLSVGIENVNDIISDLKNIIE